MISSSFFRASWTFISWRLMSSSEMTRVYNTIHQHLQWSKIILYTRCQHNPDMGISNTRITAVHDSLIPTCTRGCSVLIWAPGFFCKADLGAFWPIKGWVLRCRAAAMLCSIASVDNSGPAPCMFFGSSSVLNISSVGSHALSPWRRFSQNNCYQKILYYYKYSF